jgi:hypothetical protein
VISILVSALITVALVVQIWEQVDRQTLIPEHYFSYFSIQTSIANIAILMASGIIGFQSRRDRPGLVVFRALIVGYSVITMAIYNLLLRSVLEETLPDAAAPWPLEVLHVGVPIYLALDWILNPHRSKLTWWFLPLGALYPAIWFGASILQGSTSGWYPYEFLDPTGDGGWRDVLMFLGMMGIFAFVIFTVLVLINRVHQRLHRGHISQL